MLWQTASVCSKKGQERGALTRGNDRAHTRRSTTRSALPAVATDARLRSLAVQLRSVSVMAASQNPFSMSRRGPTDPRAHGKNMPRTSFTLCCSTWRPPTTVYQTKTENCAVEVVDRKALHSDWQCIEERGYGTNFSVGAIPLSLYDQGRAVCGVYRSMGVGVKVTSQRFVSSREVVARAGTRLLSFVIVARTSGDADAAVALCQRLRVGGEMGYGLLRDGRITLVYDIARSSAWFVNVARATDTTAKPRINLRMCVSRRHWTASFVATKTLRLGDGLFAPYGIGSSHHATIAAEARRSAKCEPVCHARRRARVEQLAEARAKRARARP